MKATVIERGEPITGKVRLPKLRGGEKIAVVWGDSLGRECARLESSARAGQACASFRFDTAAAVTMENCVRVYVDGRQLKGSSRFIVSPKAYAWDDYQLILWATHEDRRSLDLLREIGFNGMMSMLPRSGAELRRHGMRYFIDQVASSKMTMHRNPKWGPLRRRYRTARGKRTLLHRPTCLSRPGVLDADVARIEKLTPRHRPVHPLFYDLVDEAGLGDLAAPFDFCFSPHCMKRFHQWLHSCYGSVEQLNRQWGMNYESFDQAVPMTTDEAMNSFDNLSSWADHRDFMEDVLVGGFNTLTRALKSVDPDAVGGMAGGQAPAAFGGYNYEKLVPAHQIIESYDLGSSCEVIRSFQGAGQLRFDTGFDTGPKMVHMLWYTLLHGTRGTVFWGMDDGYPFLDRRGRPTSQYRLLAPTLSKFRSGTAALLMNSQRLDDSIAVHYSQPSIRAHWMLEWRQDGQRWSDSHPWEVSQDSDFVALRQSAISLIEDLQLQYRFVGGGHIESGALRQGDYRVLYLPQSIALSSQEAEEITRFVRRGGTVIADNLTGLMDDHCKRRQTGVLDSLFGVERAEAPILKPSYERKFGDIPRTRVFKTDVPPQIDGKLTDPVWEQAETCRDLQFNHSVLGRAHIEGAVTHTTRVRLLFDDENLYLGVRLNDGEPPQTSALGPAANDRRDVLKATDRLEIMIDPEHSHEDFFHIAIDPYGRVWDSRRRYPGRLNDVGWNSHAHVKTSCGSDAWFVEMALPLKNLELDPEATHSWGLQIVRYRKRPGIDSKKVMTLWMPTCEPATLRPVKFGHARLQVPGVDYCAPRLDELRMRADNRSLRIRAADPHIRAARGAEVLADAGDVPGFIVNKVGKGKAVYLNANLLDYWSWRLSDSDQALGIKTMIGGILHEAKARPEVAVAARDGTEVPMVEISRFRNGKTQLIGVMRNPLIKMAEWGTWLHPQPDELWQSCQSCTVRLRDKAHLYDVLEGTYLGFSDQADFALEWQTPFLVAALPYRVDGIDVEAPETIEAGETLALDVAVRVGGEADTHVFNAVTLDPRGKRVWWHSDNHMAPGGRCRFDLPIARNARTGDWTVIITDATTGTTETVEFAVTIRSARESR